MPEIRARLLALLAELGLAGDGAEPPSTARLKEDLSVDSLGMVRLVRALNERFGIRIRAREMVPSNFATLADLETFLDEKTKSD